MQTKCLVNTDIVKFDVEENFDANQVSAIALFWSLHSLRSFRMTEGASFSYSLLQNDTGRFVILNERQNALSLSF